MIDGPTRAQGGVEVFEGVVRRLRQLGRRTPKQPVLTVIVPVYNVAPYLAECLDSLLGQSLAEIEVVAVDDGSTDDSPRILREYAGRDPRLTVLTQANAGQGAARNLAVDAARGEFLTFCDADDVVPTTAYALMVDTLRRTGSEMVIGGTDRFTHGTTVSVGFNGLVHDRDHLSTTIEEFPLAMLDIIACNRVIRTEVWRDRIPRFRGGIAYEDHVPMLAAYLRVRRFDSLAAVTYHWRIREDRTSTGQQKASLQNLLDRIEVKQEAHELLLAEASPAVYDAWLARTLEIDFRNYLVPALSADDTYRAALQEALATTFERASQSALDRTAYLPKVRTWLGSQGAWEQLIAVDDHTRRLGTDPEIALDDGRAIAVPAPDSPLAVIPEHLRTLAPQELPGRAALRQIEDGATLTVYTIIGGVDTSAYPPAVTASLTHPGGVTLPLAVEPLDDPGADLWARSAVASARHGAVRLRPDAADLAAAPDGDWQVDLRITQGGLSRETRVMSVVSGSQAAALPSVAIGDRAATPVITGAGLALRVGGPAPTPVDEPLLVRDIAVTDDELRLGLAPTSLDLSTARLLGKRHDLPLRRSPDDLTLSVDSRTVDPAGSPVTLSPGGYSLAVDLDGLLKRARPHPELLGRLPLTVSGGSLRVTLSQRPNGTLAVTLAPPRAPDELSDLDQQRLRTAYAVEVVTPASATVLLWSDRGHEVAGEPLALDAALARLRPDLTRVWAVRHLGLAVPEGTRAVVIGTRAWYDLLAAATFVVTDSEPEPWFAKRPHQRLVQTFRGHPFKTMGRGRYAERGWPPGRIALELERRTHLWDAGLAAGPEDADRYADAYPGLKVVATGLPSEDALVAPDLSIRKGVRARLGLAPDVTAVLWAPTYRDTLTNRVTTARLTDDLDPVALAERLGPAYRVLARPHRRDARDATARWAESNAVDLVADWPRVGDLLAAADVAVLDYSALRFAWALTGKPAVCFVPDEADYLAVRGGLLPYDETCPGPRATTLDDLAAQLSDVAALGELCRPLQERMRARFSPLADGGAAERIVKQLFD